MAYLPEWKPGNSYTYVGDPWVWSRGISNGECVGRAGHIITGAHMPKPENPGSQGQAARNKPNRGQDEKTHTFVNTATGETRVENQRWFRDEGRDQGFTKPEDAAEAAPTPTPETPA